MIAAVEARQNAASRHWSLTGISGLLRERPCGAANTLATASSSGKTSTLNRHVIGLDINAVRLATIPIARAMPESP